MILDGDNASSGRARRCGETRDDARRTRHDSLAASAQDERLGGSVDRPSRPPQL